MCRAEFRSLVFTLGRPKCNAGSRIAARNGLREGRRPQANGMVLLQGPGVGENTAVPDGGMASLTPTVLRLFGLPQARDMAPSLAVVGIAAYVLTLQLLLCCLCSGGRICRGGLSQH